MRAMILAAGTGGRMMPLTKDKPKCLVTVNGETLIGHHIIALAKCGVNEIVINLSHYKELVQETLGSGEQFGVTLQYSLEETPLETGGGIVKALPLLGDEPFIVMSCDVWCDYPRANLLDRKTEQAHIVLVNNPPFHTRGDFHLQGDFVHESEGPRFTYANIGVYHPSFFEGCEPTKFRLSDLLYPAVSAGKVTGEYYAGEWTNLNTVEQLRSVEEKTS